MADPLEDKLSAAARHISDLRTIVAGLLGLLVVAFTGGLLWSKLIDYEHEVDALQKQGTLLQQDTFRLRLNLGSLSEPHYEKEVTNTPEKGPVRCQEGSVVTGMRFDQNRIWIVCSSLGRAAWNPVTPDQQSKNPESQVSRLSP
jgi:hypothetical protein